MGTYEARIVWRRDGAVFTDLRYSRRHAWTFDGGASVPASASPHVVPVPCSDPSAVDPEEAFVAAIASCHMLTFLWLAARAGHVVESWDDTAVGTMGRGPEGRESVVRVVLRPAIRFAGEAPSDEALRRLHHEAHEQCYIANSVKTEIVVECDGDAARRT